MRIILTGGGTGGHIYPAIAIGQAIRSKWPDTEFLYIGTKEGMEGKIVPESGFPFQSIEVIGWERKLSLQALRAGWKALTALYHSQRLVRQFSPQLVIGTGGYVCLPVVWAAAHSKIPTLIHEQNAMPGLTNRFLSRKVEGVLLTFDRSRKYFPQRLQQKLHVTGLPVRSDILRVSREEGLAFFGLSPKKATLVGVGGSRGARSINQAMLTVCRKLADHPDVQIIHLTGTAGYTEFKSSLHAHGITEGNCGNIIIRPYLHEMEYALACADLCVARAGAAFLSEMTAKGIPGVLIPYPYATENHQEHNAASLAGVQAAEMILDSCLTGEVLLERVEELLFDEKKRKQMAANSLNAGKPEAVTKILEIIKRVI